MVQWLQMSHPYREGANPLVSRLSPMFSFRPHWQATPVNVSLAGCGAAACASGELTVVDEWGDNTTAVFRCE